MSSFNGWRLGRERDHYEASSFGIAATCDSEVLEEKRLSIYDGAVRSLKFYRDKESTCLYLQRMWKGVGYFYVASARFLFLVIRIRVRLLRSSVCYKLCKLEILKILSV